MESDQVALKRCRFAAVIAAGPTSPTAGGGALVTVRRSQTNQEGEAKDVWFVKEGAARALRTLRTATSPEPGDRVVPLSPQMVPHSGSGCRRS